MSQHHRLPLPQQLLPPLLPQQQHYPKLTAVSMTLNVLLIVVFLVVDLEGGGAVTTLSPLLHNNINDNNNDNPQHARPTSKYNNHNQQYHQHQHYDSSAASDLVVSDCPWRGGHPIADRAHSCASTTTTTTLSSTTSKCQCTASWSIDVILVSNDDSNNKANNYVWLVRRRDNDMLATMGGFVRVGERLVETVRRELQEEMQLTSSTTTKVQLAGFYSDAQRDNRRHTVTALFVVVLDSQQQPVAADDAKAVVRIPLDELEKYEYFADHRALLLDYRQRVRQQPQRQQQQAIIDDSSSSSSLHQFPDRTYRNLCGETLWDAQQRVQQ